MELSLECECKEYYWYDGHDNCNLCENKKCSTCSDATMNCGKNKLFNYFFYDNFYL